MAADLHCHTKLSDGSVGIEDLIVIAQKAALTPSPLLTMTALQVPYAVK